MTFSRLIQAGLLATAGLAPLAAAQAAAPCPARAGSPVTIGTISAVSAGQTQAFALTLGAGEGVAIDLDRIAPVPPTTATDGDMMSDGSTPPPVPRTLALCSAGGDLLAPMAGEVFEKGGSYMTTPDGERLRFTAPAAGQYVIAVTSTDTARELLVRRRDLGAGMAAIRPITLDSTTTGSVSTTSQMMYSFNATAGQWIELKSTSESDTLLRLAGPDRTGTYSVLAENDDSDGLNPLLRRKLPTAGTYFVQVDSLAEAPGEFVLSAKRIPAPAPAPAPAALRLGATASGRLADTDAVMIYALPVIAGHSYQLVLTAAYDGVVAIGLPNPLEADDGNQAADANFSEVKAQDSGVTGTERLNFAARTSGQLLVRVKSYGIGETDGAYTLVATDLGA